ncbi:MAG: large subunit ribosomal protein [Candidatus Methanomethylophilaceae archaeon]|nr:large subunit ribosomal protein [Candidatus Methanomethylophilaceae archaeon]MDI3541358.1 large subunit ribosomal protein [Candidatus Methanomethylophilaceae archaeon]HIJ00323.1 50S ribosomal protein L11 [Candidatus Methanomethylophilaceae archaeon]
MADIVEALVDGGKASAGPPLGPALGPKGVNIGQVIAAINEKTRAFAGMKVPVKVIIDEKKNFEIRVGTPPTSALIKAELGLQKGSSNTRTDKVGNLDIETIKKIADMKKEDLLGADLKARALEVAGTCVSMGITVDGKEPKAFQKAVKDGEYANVF